MEQYLVDFIDTLDGLQKKVIDELGDTPGFSRLTISQLQYIEAVAAISEPSISEVATRMHLSKASVTTSVNKLIARGYLTKTQSSIDKRVMHVQLTPVSERILNAKYAALSHLSAMVTSALSPTEAEQFKVTLTKIVQSFRQA